MTTAPFLAESGVLSKDEFENACRRLHEIAGSHESDFNLYLRSQAGVIYLHITKKFKTSDDVLSEHARVELDGGEEVIEEPDESAVHPLSQPTVNASVEYDIVLSTSYRVPVLYFSLRGLPSDGPQDLDAVYSYLVPASAAARRLRGIGILGGVSVTNHPVTDTPCFFVHPCNTVEAMKDITGEQSVTSLQYLQIWFGLIGTTLGLNLPIELAAELSK